MLKKEASKIVGGPDTLVGQERRFVNRPDNARGRRARWVIGLMALLVVSLSTDCAWLKRRAVSWRGQKGLESEIHALPIAPDVDYATALDLGEGRKLYCSDRDLIYAKDDHFYPIVVRGYPRLVGLSPAGDKVAFLEPAEFEMATDLYVFDVPARSLRRLTEHRDQASTLSVKAARWFDNRTLYYLEGYRYGTVSRGGDLWRVDVPSIARQPIVHIMRNEGGFEEIVEFEFVPDRKMIRYVAVRYDELGSETRQARYCALDGKPIP